MPKVKQIEYKPKKEKIMPILNNLDEPNIVDALDIIGCLIYKHRVYFLLLSNILTLTYLIVR